METLNFTLHYEWILLIGTFTNSSRGSDAWEEHIFTEEMTPEEYFQKVIDQENKNRASSGALRHRDVIYHYHVTKSEVMTDDRSKFGHENAKSTKEMVQIIPKTYTRGMVMTLGEALAKSANDKFSVDVKENLLSCIHGLDFDAKNLKEKELDVKVIMIPGEGARQTFFEAFEDSAEIHFFPEDKLLPINEN